MLKSIDTSCKQAVYLQSQSSSSPSYMWYEMMYVMAKVWVRRRPFFGWLFSDIYRVSKFQKGYDKPLVSTSYPWSRSPAKRMWEEGGVGTVAEAKLVPWISVCWSISESKRNAWCLWKVNWCKFCRIDHLYVSNAAMHQTWTSGILVNKSCAVAVSPEGALGCLGFLSVTGETEKKWWPRKWSESWKW